MLDWRPDNGGRSVGHPAKSWLDEIEEAMATMLPDSAAGDWRIAAANREEWQQLGEELAAVRAKAAEESSKEEEEEDDGCR